MELVELIRALMALDRAEVVKALQKEGQPIFQDVFNKGHTVGAKKSEGEMTTLQGTVTTLEGEVTTLKGKLEAAEKAQPDIAKIRGDHETQITQLKTAHKAEVKELKEGHIGEKRDGDLLRFKSKLVTAGVNPEYADVLAEKKANRDRFNYRKDDGKLEVFQAGSTTPMMPGEGKDAIDLLVDEVLPTVPPQWKGSTTDTGSNNRPGPSGTDNWGDFRKKVEAERAADDKKAIVTTEDLTTRLATARG